MMRKIDYNELKNFSFLTENNKKTTLRDRGIFLLTGLLEKNKPEVGSFRDKVNRIIREKLVQLPESATQTYPSFEEEVAEENLPIVEELLEKADQAIKEGMYPGGKEINPFNIEEMKYCELNFFGDIHQPGSEPSEAVRELNKIYKILNRVNPKQLRSGIKNAILRFRQRNTAEDKQLEESGDWIHEGAGIAQAEGYEAIKRTLERRISQNRREHKAVVMVNIGDFGHNESKAGDNAYTLVNFEDFRQELSERIQKEVKVVQSMGNHDSDTINHGLDQDLFMRESLGSQIFAQEVGNHTMVVSVDTNFTSQFWRKYVLVEIDRLRERNHQLHKLKQSGQENTTEAQYLEKWCKRQIQALNKLEQDYQRQKRVVEYAQKSGKDLILIGHDADAFEQIFGDLKNTNVIKTVAGHTHGYKRKLGKLNTKGEQIDSLVVGAALEKRNGMDVAVYRGWTLTVTPRNDGPDSVFVDSIEPENKDFYTL